MARLKLAAHENPQGALAVLLRETYRDGRRDERDDLRAAEAAARAVADREADAGPKVRDCAGLLAHLLADGPRRGADVRPVLEANGFSASTIERARRLTGVRADRGPGGLWRPAG